MLVKNLERFFGDNSINLSLIVVFDKATNLFIPGISDLEIPDLDTGCYIAFNHILNYLKKLLKWFFMLFTESRIEKLLLQDIKVKKRVKKITKIGRITLLAVCFHKVLVTKQTT